MGARAVRAVREEPGGGRGEKKKGGEGNGEMGQAGGGGCQGLLQWHTACGLWMHTGHKAGRVRVTAN